MNMTKDRANYVLNAFYQCPIPHRAYDKIQCDGCSFREGCWSEKDLREAVGIHLGLLAPKE